MDLAAFFTVQTPQGQQGALSKGTGAGAAPAGLFAPTEGGSIFDLLLGQILEEQEKSEDSTLTQEDKAATETALQSDNPLLEETPALNIARILADNPDIQDDVEALSKVLNLDVIGEIQATLALNQQALDKTLKPLTDGVITAEAVEAGSPRLINGLVVDEEKLQEEVSSIEFKGFLDFLESISYTGKDGERDTDIVSFASAINLTPEEITELQTELRVDDAETKAKPSENRLFDFIVSLVAPAVQQQAQIDNELTDNKDIAEQLNDIIVGGTGDDALQILRTPLAPSPTLPSNATPVSGVSSGQDFNGVLKQYIDSDARNNAATLPDEAATKPEAPANNNAPAANGNAAQNASTAPGLLSTLPASLTTGVLDFASSPNGVNDNIGAGFSALSGTSAQGLSALVTQAASASAPHPATSLVAAHIQKSAQGNGNTQITLQLDPAELGRVEVQMTFSKDKSLKAIVTAEKPETFLMLQRDAQVLERALQDTGLDSEGGLSFELAEDGQFFDQQNQRGGGHENGGTGGGEDAEDGVEILETTMTWHVDPETGHTRYDIWV